MATQTGYLVLADISGFTAYLAGVELEHAHEILSNLLETISAKFKSLLTISKYEGDAIFAYVPASQVVRGETLLELLETSYLAFRDRVTAMHRNTTCTCNACRGISSLDLKFMTHYGEYVQHTIAGSQEIMGSDVNLVHRLLKNHVSESAGWRAYALFSGAALQQIGVSAEEYHQQVENYEHLGDVPTYTYDLHTRYKTLLEARRVFLEPADAYGEEIVELDTHPLDAWEWLNLPERRGQWLPGTRWSAGERIQGRTQAGAKNHCAHGKDFQESALESILDLRPFDYFTVEQGPMPLNQVLILTFILEPLAEGQRTRLTMRGRVQSPSGPAFIGKIMYRLMIAGMVRGMAQAVRAVIAKTHRPNQLL